VNVRLAGVIVAAVWALEGVSVAIHDPADRMLTRILPLTRADVGRITAGRTVVRSLATADGREVATLGAVAMNVRPAYYASLLRNITKFKQSDAVLQIGTFSASPVLADVKRLTIGARDIDRLRECEIRDCGVQLPAAAISDLRQVKWSAPDAAVRANARLRELLVEYVRSYRARGTAALMQYVDGSVPVDVATEFRSLVESEPRILWHFPPLYRHMLSYPANRRSDIDDVLYWSKQQIGARQVVTITHLAIWRSADPHLPPYIAASKQIYGSVYFDASIGVTLLVPVGDHRTIVAYVNRSRVDVFGGLLGPIKRGLVRMRARAVMGGLLTRTKDRLESDCHVAGLTK